MLLKNCRKYEEKSVNTNWLNLRRKKECMISDKILNELSHRERRLYFEKGKNGLCIWKIFWRWMWPKIYKNSFIVHLVDNIDENLWLKSKVFFTYMFVVYLSVCLSVPQFIFLTILLKWVNVEESFFFLVCINIWLSIWTPLPVVIKKWLSNSEERRYCLFAVKKRA